MRKIILAVAAVTILSFLLFIGIEEQRSNFFAKLEGPFNSINPNSYYGSPAYYALPASTQLGQLWSELIANTTSHAWYSSFQQAQLITEDKSYVFGYKGDALPGTFKKLIHTVGVVAKAQFIPTTNNNYTGIFNGSDYALVRLSVAAEYDTSKPAHGNFVPAAAIKFLRNNATSANFFSLFSLDGNPNWNFFGENFTNHLPVPDNTVQNWVLGNSFSAVTQYIETIGLKNLGSVDQYGNYVTNPNYPWRVILQPTPAAVNLFSNNYTQPFTTLIPQLPAGSTLFNVYAIANPAQACKQLIGFVRITTNFTTSNWGDQSLFLSHDDMSIDLAQHQPWVPYTPYWGTFGNVQGKQEGVCPFSKYY